MFSFGNWSEALFKDNNATDTGGACYLLTTAPGYRVTSSTFRENAAASQDGGALLESGDPSFYEGCTFESNSAGDDGGAVSSSGTTSTFENCLFKGNFASDDGGGMWTLSSSPNLNDCAFHGNLAGDDGGGLALGFSSHPKMSNSWIWQNAASGVTNTSSASALIPASGSLSFIQESSYLQNFGEASFLFDGINGPEICVASKLNPLSSPQTGGDLHLVYPSVSLPSDRQQLLGPHLSRKFIVATEDSSSLRAALAAADPFDVVYLPAGNYSLGIEGLTVRPGTQLGSAPPALPGSVFSSGPLELTPPQELFQGAYRPYLTTGDTSTFSLQGGATLFNLEVSGGSADEPASLVNLGSAIRAGSTGLVQVFDSQIIGGIHSEGSDLSLHRTQMKAAAFTISSLSASDSDLFLQDCFFARSQKIQVTNGSLSAVNTEFGGLRGGAIIADSSTVSLTNCGFTRTGGVVTETHDIQILNNSDFFAINTFAWGNVEFAGDPTPFDWILTDASSSSSFSHCLIQGMNPPGSGNIDGTNLANDPQVIGLTTERLSIDRALPSHLSNCIDAGLSSANLTLKDLNNSDRIRGSSIDIGPHEHHRIHVDENATIGGDGSSWTSAYQDIPADLTAMRGATSIYVAEGNYSQELHTPTGIQLFGGFPSGGSSFSLRQPSVHQTFLEGGIKNLKTVADTTSQRSSDFIPGILDGFVFEDYVASAGGGAPGPLEMGRIQIVENCLFQNNSNTYGFGTVSPGGAAIRIPAASISKVRNCRFEGNSSATWGGAILVFGQEQTLAEQRDGSHLFEKCLFLSNTAGLGGAIMLQNDFIRYREVPERHPKMFSLFEDCVFKGNSADPSGSGQGGALYLGPGAFGVVRDCVLQGNYSNDLGGAVGRDIRRTLIGQNVSSVSFMNCTLQGNFAGRLGGAVDGVAQYANTILWGNRGAEGSDNFSEPLPSFNQFNTFQNCLVEGVNLAEDFSGMGNLDGTDSANNPQFRVEISATESPTLRGDLRLTTGSPILHAGDNDTSTLGGIQPQNGTDADGDTRIQGPAIALGAYETPIAPYFTPAETALWESDIDGDGTSHGAELLLGTDPNVADPCHPNAFTLISAGPNQFQSTNRASVTLGVSPTAPSDTIWVVSRSATLQPNSFRDILLFDGTDFTNVNLFPNQSTFSLDNGLINLVATSLFRTDNGFIEYPKAFFRFEARRTPDVSYPN